MGKVLLGKPGGDSVDMGMLTKERGTKSAFILEVSNYLVKMSLVGLFLNTQIFNYVYTYYAKLADDLIRVLGACLELQSKDIKA
jgi:hypothetical protein